MVLHTSVQEALYNLYLLYIFPMHMTSLLQHLDWNHQVYELKYVVTDEDANTIENVSAIQYI